MDLKLELLTPWGPPHSPGGIEAELRKEAGPEHPLYGIEAAALAVARDRDVFSSESEGLVHSGMPSCT